MGLVQRHHYRLGPFGGWLVALCILLLLPGCTAFRGAKAYQRGSAALERGDTPLAIAELESAAALLPHASEIQNHLGIAYSMEGRDDEALVALRRAVELDCDNQAALRNLLAAEDRLADASEPPRSDRPDAREAEPGHPP